MVHGSLMFLVLFEDNAPPTHPTKITEALPVCAKFGVSWPLREHSGPGHSGGALIFRRQPHWKPLTSQAR